MPGARLAAVRWGDVSELLCEFVLSPMAFCSRVPRQEDVGSDLFCVLYEREGDLLKAGPFFTVQVKSGPEPLLFSKPYEIAWLRDQENPYFLCVVDKEERCIRFYSTWNVHNAFLGFGARSVQLVPGEPVNSETPVIPSEDPGQPVRVPLGEPLVRASLQDVVDEKRSAALSAVLRSWILLDRQNIVLKSAGMYWVVGPSTYETNRPVDASAGCNIYFYWHPDNLQVCEENFGKVATALRLVLRSALGEARESEMRFRRPVRVLDDALVAFQDVLNPLARKVLYEQIGLAFEDQKTAGPDA